MRCTCHTPDPIANTGGWDERCPDCRTCYACCSCGWEATDAPFEQGHELDPQLAELVDAGDHRAILDRVHRTALDKANRKWWKQNRPASMKEGAD